MRIRSARLLLPFALLWLASSASGVGLMLGPPSSGPGDEIEFSVTLDAPTVINGYDVTSGRLLSSFGELRDDGTTRAPERRSAVSRQRNPDRSSGAGY